MNHKQQLPTIRMMINKKGWDKTRIQNYGSGKRGTEAEKGGTEAEKGIKRGKKDKTRKKE